MIGKSIAHYRVTEMLGKGGMGEVYRATGVRTKAAELLKMSYRSFRHYAQKHQI